MCSMFEGECILLERHESRVSAFEVRSPCLRLASHLYCLASMEQTLQV